MIWPACRRRRRTGRCPRRQRDCFADMDRILARERKGCQRTERQRACIPAWWTGCGSRRNGSRPWRRGSVRSSALPDPVGEVLDRFLRPNGLQIEKRRVPLGVIGIIYESRPNVTADAFAPVLQGGERLHPEGRKRRAFLQSGDHGEPPGLSGPECGINARTPCSSSPIRTGR